MGVKEDLEIRTVRTYAELRSFIHLQHLINAGEEHWIRPLYAQEKKDLDRGRNPFFEYAEAEFFMALREGRPVGRIAAIENRLHNIYHGDRVGFFGYYEAVDDVEVSKALFFTAEEWLKKRGMRFMRGPINTSMNGCIGFLIEGFDYPPSMLMPYTKKYYINHALAGGFRKIMDVIVYGWHFKAYGTAEHMHFMDKLERLGRYAKKKSNIRVRCFNPKDVAREIKVIKEICNQSLKDNWGYVPLTDGDMEAFKKELLRIIDPDFFYIAELDGKPEGVFLACPDYNQIISRMNGRLFPLGWLKFLLYRGRIDKFTIYLFAATPRGERAGIAAPVYARFFRECLKRKVRDYETGYVLENNVQLRKMLERLGATKRKRYRLFQKPI